MREMRKEISRLNAMIGEKCIKVNKAVSGKENQPKKPQYKDGRHPHVKDGLGHKEGTKTNGRKVINGYECVNFTSKGKIGREQRAQKVAPRQPQVAMPAKGGSAAMKGDSVAPHRKGKATYFFYASGKPKRQVSQAKQKLHKSKDSIWGIPNKVAYRPKVQAPRQSLSSCFVLKNNSKGAVCQICWQG